MIIMKKKRISFISLQAYSLFNEGCSQVHGGSEVQLYQLAKVFSERELEFDVSFIVGDFGQKNEEIFGKIKVIKSIPLNVKKMKYIIGIFYFFKFFYVLIKANSDVYIQRAAGIETGLTAFFCKLFKRKFIYMTASEMDVDGKYKKNNFISGFLYEYGLTRASVVITQNEDHRKILMKQYSKKSVVIKNSFFISEKVDICQKDSILWVGTSQSLKQPEIFLKMAESIPEEKFVIIMPKHNLKLWEKIKKDAININNLEFIERVPFAEIEKFFMKAKLFINTSTFEGFPNTFVQSAINYTPILSLNVDPDGFLEKNNCGFCTHGDVDKLIKYTKELASNNEKINNMGMAAYEYARENNDVIKNIKKIKELIF